MFPRAVPKLIRSNLQLRLSLLALLHPVFVYPGGVARQGEETSGRMRD